MASLMSIWCPMPMPMQRRLCCHHNNLYRQPSPSLSPISLFNNKTQTRGGGRVNCLPTRDTDAAESHIETTPSVSSTHKPNPKQWWFSVLGGIGFLETSYLTYLKLTNSDAFCPFGGGASSCGDVLSSHYALLFGVPLPLIGMVAYGLVAALGLQFPGKKLPFGITDTSSRLILVGTTTSMAAASGYFLYILSTKFPGALCSYCLTSAFLSFSLFFLTLKDFGIQEMQKFLGLQLCMASLVIVTLGASYGTYKPASSSLAEVDLQYFTTEITSPSSPFSISLAKHLRSIGAKMYGAFWCSHCLEQKQMFGKDASELLIYVECFPDGYKTGTRMAKACVDAKIEGFPTWVIKDQVLSGEQELSELAGVSGFKLN